MLKLLTFASLALSFNLWSTDANPEPTTPEAEGKFYSRQHWGAQPGGPNFYTHEARGFKHELPKTIVLDHTGLDLGDSIITMRAIQRTQMDAHGPFKYNDIAFNRYIDSAGNEFEGRSKEVMPSVCPGRNLGKYVVGFIGRFDGQENAKEVDGNMVIRWGKALGKLAFELEFDSLTVKKNVVTTCQLAGEQDQLNRRKKILDKLHLIVYVANQHLMNLRKAQLQK